MSRLKHSKFPAETSIMRSIIVLTALANVLLLSACSTIRTVQPDRVTQAPSDCPELEGYPDCQDGHHVEFPAAERVAAK